ncbi:hypothetical protein ACIQUB_30015 [Rhizobium sp. NPDC090275]|uniref:hypothetical protein n=1 Tax=Rhizobium sp. NPDC090275 TaxID=3364498 RepID=UPI00383A07EC
MNDNKKSMEDDDLSDILANLVKQNYHMSQRLVGLQATCAMLLSEVCKLSPDPRGSLVRICGELDGLASGVAEKFEVLQAEECIFDSRGISESIETVMTLAQEGFFPR